MAWTAPRTWTNGEVVTDTFMNVHVRDNLKYLKGQAGTIAFEAAATFAGTVAVTGGITATTTIAATGDLSGAVGTLTASARQLICANSSAAFNDFFGITNASLAIWDVNRDPATGTFGDTAKSHARIGLDGSASASFIQFLTASAANTTGSERVRITGAGDVGIGLTVPQGLLHGYDTIGGFLYWEFDGVDGTLRTIIPNAAGDVGFGMFAKCVVRHSGTGTVLGLDLAILTPGNTVNLYNVGGNTCAFAVAADGSVTVQRTAGTGTYKVVFWLLWL